MNIQGKIGPQYSPTQQIDVHADTREILAAARRNAIKRGLQDWFVCDIDAHHVETVSWKEIVTYIEDPVVRDNAVRFQNERIGAPPYGLNGDLGLRYQSVGGRIPHQDGQREIVEETGVHRDVVLTRRAMDSLGIDNMVVFPTPMLFLGLHPQIEVEVASVVTQLTLSVITAGGGTGSRPFRRDLRSFTAPSRAGRTRLCRGRCVRA